MNAKLETGAIILKFLKENKPYLLTALLTVLLNGTTTLPAYMVMETETTYEQKAKSASVELSELKQQLLEYEQINASLEKEVKDYEDKVYKLNGKIELKDELIEILKQKESEPVSSETKDTDWPF